MAAAEKAAGGRRRGGAAVPGVLLLLAAGAGAGAWGLHGRMVRAESDLERYKGEYRRMVSMRRRLEEIRRTVPSPPAASEGEGGEDLLATLGAKARQANLPAGAMTIARNPDRREGGWKEVSYTVTLRAPGKDQPLPGAAVADFLSRVERERAAVKAKNLSLTFSGPNFASVTVTFSHFQREAVGP